MSGKNKTHTRYRNSKGDIVPGVTTILGVLNKPALVHWAWDLGSKGIDYRKYRDDKADIGTLAHYLIMCDLTGEKPDTSDYSEKQIDQAENSVLSYLEWKKGKVVKPILVETSLVSEEDGYGGTIDLFAWIDDVRTLVDFKTGKAIYSDMFYQLAAYNALLSKNGHEACDIRLLRIGRDENEGFDNKKVDDLSLELRIFENCLSTYKLQKEIKKNRG